MACTGLYNIEIKQGNSYSLTVTITGSNGSVINLTDYSGYAIIKPNYGSDLILKQFILDFAAPTSGVLTMSINSTGTASIPMGQHLYELEIYPTGNTLYATKYLYGYCEICPQLSS